MYIHVSTFDCVRFRAGQIWMGLFLVMVVIVFFVIPTEHLLTVKHTVEVSPLSDVAGDVSGDTCS